MMLSFRSRQQHGTHGGKVQICNMTDDFIFQRGDAKGSRSSVQLGDVLALDGVCSIGPLLYPPVQVMEPRLQLLPIALPGHPVNAGGCVTLQRIVRLTEAVHGEVMEERRHALGFIPTDCLTYTSQRLGHVSPALCPVRVS